MTKPRKQLCAAALAAALALALAGCGQPVTGSTATSGRDALYFADNASGLPPMYQGEPYTADLSISGGAGPYSLKVGSGTLPPGVTLGGQRLNGTPTKTGVYKFTVEVTDSTLSTRSKEYTLNVNVLPPLALSPTLPSGEIRGETRIPLTITAPRNVRAARLSWELPANASVTRVEASGQGSVLFWKQDGQMLLVDLGFKTVPRTGVRIALITVKPSKPVTLSVTKLGYEARDGKGVLLAEKKLPEPPKPAVTPGTATPGTAAPGTAAPGTATPGSAAPAATPEKKPEDPAKPTDTKPDDTKPAETQPTETTPAAPTGTSPAETPSTPPANNPGDGLPPGTPPKPPGQTPPGGKP